MRRSLIWGAVIGTGCGVPVAFLLAYLTQPRAFYGFVLGFACGSFGALAGITISAMRAAR